MITGEDTDAGLQVTIEKSDAAIVFAPDGRRDVFLPKGPDDKAIERGSPEWMASLFALTAGDPEAMDWLERRFFADDEAAKDA